MKKTTRSKSVWTVLLTVIMSFFFACNLMAQASEDATFTKTYKESIDEDVGYDLTKMTGQFSLKGINEDYLKTKNERELLNSKGGDSLNCKVKGRYNRDNYLFSLSVADTLAYLTYGEDGLFIVNISNPQEPIEIGRFTDGNLIHRVFAADTLVYITELDIGGIRILNVSDPTAPVEIGHYDIGLNVKGLLVVNTLIYVTYYNDNALRIIDVSNPCNPVEAGSFSTPGASPNQVYVVDDLAYITYGIADIDLRIINISDPSNPVEVGNYIMRGKAWGVYVEDTLAYITDSYGIHILDVSDPSAPLEVAYYSNMWDEDDGQSCVWKVVIQGNYGYISNGSRGLHIIDVSDPSTPFEVGYYNTEGTSVKAFLIDSLVYVNDAWGEFYILEPFNLDEQPDIAVTPNILDVFIDSSFVQTIDTLYYDDGSFEGAHGIFSSSSPHVLSPARTTGFATLFEHTYTKLLGVMLNVRVVADSTLRLYVWENSIYDLPRSAYSPIFRDDNIRPISEEWTYVDLESNNIYLPSNFWVGACYNRLLQQGPGWWLRTDGDTPDYHTYIGYSFPSSWEEAEPKAYGIRAVVAHEGAVVEELTLSNEGLGNLRISEFTFDEEWINVITPTPFIIEPGDTKTVLVAINGSGLAGGSYSGELHVHSNDPDEPFCDMLVKLHIGTGIGIDEENLSVPSISQNAPNPFKSETTIKFIIDNDSNVEITIYNFNGQKIKTLVNKKLYAGSHQVVWDGTDDSGNPVSSGIYLYKMQNNIFSETKKIILIN